VGLPARRLRAAAAPLRNSGVTVHESELRVDYPGGGQVRLYGADNPDALRGIYLDGVVLDEYADMDPRVWSEVIRPALVDRRGWAVFIGTPKGRNGFFKLWRRAQSEPDWFAMMLKASETGLIAESELALARRDLSEEQYAQEFECSFDAAVIGSYYGKQLLRAELDKRIANVPHEPESMVWTAWDLGIRDATAIWFAQVIGREIRIIDYYEASGVDLGHYVREINARPYVYAGHIVPHDAQVKELATGKTRIEVLQSLGVKNITSQLRRKSCTCATMQPRAAANPLFWSRPKAASTRARSTRHQPGAGTRSCSRVSHVRSSKAWPEASGCARTVSPSCARPPRPRPHHLRCRGSNTRRRCRE